MTIGAGPAEPVKVLVLDTSIAPPPGPTYSLVADPPIVDEGAVVTFRLSTTGVPAGTTLPYRLTGISEADVSGPLSGVMTVFDDGSAVVGVALRADGATEGIETIRCSVGDGLATVTATVRDTSTAPPPPPGTRVEVRGPNVLRKPPGGLNNFDNGILDYLDVSDLPPPAPWEVYADDRQTLAPSRGGVEALHLWQRYHLFGHTQGLYQPMPRMVDGQLRQIYPNAGNFPEHAVLKLRVGPAGGGEHLVHGPRGVSVPTPYTTWHGHTRREGAVVHDSPAIPLFVGLTLHGHMVYAMRDGSMVEGGIVPVESWANDFAFYEAERKIFFYVDTGGANDLVAPQVSLGGAKTPFVGGLRPAISPAPGTARKVNLLFMQPSGQTRWWQYDPDAINVDFNCVAGAQMPAPSGFTIPRGAKVAGRGAIALPRTQLLGITPKTVLIQGQELGLEFSGDLVFDDSATLAEAREISSIAIICSQ